MVLTLYIAHTCYVITTHIFLTLYVCMDADVLAYSPPYVTCLVTLLIAY